MDLYSSLCTITKEENILSRRTDVPTYDFPCGRTGRLFCHTTVSGRDPGDTRSMPERECSLLYCRKWKQSSCW